MGTPVAGPGQFSRRTDMTQKMRDLPNPDYGEGASYKALQQGAPMAASPDIRGGSLADLLGGSAPNVVSLNEGTMQPGTPVTDGASLGAGQGVEALGISTPRSKQDLQNMANQLPVLEWMGNQPNASWGLRQLVRQIKGSL